MKNKIEFIGEEPPSEKISEKSLKEDDFYNSQNLKPNTIRLNFWKGGHIYFEADNSATMFSLLSLVLTLLTIAIIEVISIFSTSKVNEIAMTALGHAITGIIGAIVGTSVSIKSRTK